MRRVASAAVATAALLGRGRRPGQRSRSISGHRAAAELLRRMLALGISRWHPDPLAAIEAAEAGRAA